MAETTGGGGQPRGIEPGGAPRGAGLASGPCVRPPAPARLRGQEVELAGHRYVLVPVDDELGAALARDAAALAQQRVAGTGQRLTARERQIATLVAEGLVNKQIAGELGISEWTVSTHLRRAFAKLGVDRRAAMVARLRGP